MDRETLGRPGQEVLPARGHLSDTLPGQVDGREPRHSEVGLRELPSAERLVETGGGRMDGVPLGHPDIIPKVVHGRDV